MIFIYIYWLILMIDGSRFFTGMDFSYHFPKKKWGYLTDGRAIKDINVI